MGTRCLLLAGSGNSPSADAASARTERDVRHHHDSDRSRWSSSAADYLRDARRADSRVFVVRGLRHGVLHSIAFAVVLSVTAYVIIDLEYPRLGFIQVSDSDQVLVDLRRSMNSSLFTGELELNP
jgi:hypothetical protein